MIQTFNKTIRTFSAINPDQLKHTALTVLAGIFTTALCQSALAEPAPTYQDTKAPLEKRVEDLFGRLNQDEKLGLLGGTGFTTQPIPRLGVPPMAMADAGQGVRGGADSTLGPATAFPTGVLMASTWDTNMIWQIGRAIGEEARNKGTGVQIELGPAVNIHRNPLGGRDAEYLTEDPYLAARLAVNYIQGMQSAGVAACVKHFAANSQETDRFVVNEDIGERALREIYFPAFEAAVKEGKVWAVMSSYNKVNGRHASANPHLLTEALKQDWQFDGLVMSDWGGVHETAAVQAGNDLEMPKGGHMSISKLKAALADGSVTQTAVDDSVHRILRTIIRVGLLDGPIAHNPAMVNSAEHSQLAYKAATEGIVLLKNDGDLLPLDHKKIKSIAVIGEPAKHLQIDALGSPVVMPLKTVEILDGIKAEAGDSVTIHYASGRTDGEPITGSVVTTPGDSHLHGFQAEYFTKPDLDGKPAVVRVEDEINISNAGSPAPGISGQKYSARWSGKLLASETGNYTFGFRGDDGFRVFLDGKLLINSWERSAARTLRGQATLEAGKTYDLRVEFFQDGGDCVAQLTWQIPGKGPYADALDAAKASDVAIVCVSTFRMEGEGRDRPSMDLPGDQAALIQAVSSANKHTIVILNAGTPVTMTNWVDHVPALLEAWFPGQEGGSAIAAILFGKVNPSGKLPDTFAASRSDYPDAPNVVKKNQVKYSEGIYIGYRHFDKAGIQPVFPFGYGLSYTTFKYSQLKLSAARLANDGTVTASLKVSNTGKRAGEEVVQLYVHAAKSPMDRPERELKGFAKVALNPGETKTISLRLTPRDLAYFDVAAHQWKADAGDYEIEIGASSRDIRLTAPLQLQQEFTENLAHEVSPNKLTAQEQSDGWKLLWDGQTTTGWRSARSEEFPAQSWQIQAGVLSVVSSGNAEGQAGGAIITRDRYANFELVADFKTTTGCNSGIKIFVQPNIAPIHKATGRTSGGGSAIGMEFQILDDANHPDAKLGHDGDRTIGSLYDLIPAPKNKIVMPVGDWNHARILSQGRHVEFWLNGQKTVEFERGSPAFHSAVAASKFKDIPGFGEWSDGHILLQEHGSVVSFRNIKIRELAAKQFQTAAND